MHKPVTTTELRLTADGVGRCRVEGRVNHATARAAYETTRAELLALLVQSNGSLRVDLSAVASANSLVLSLMLAWLRVARQSSHALTFTGVPATLQEQIRFTGLGQILPFEQGAAA